jgi:hypothetical protein
MDDQVNRPAPRHVIEFLDASVHDITAGRVHDAHAAQAEARRLLAEHEIAASSRRGPHRETSRTRSPERCRSRQRPEYGSILFGSWSLRKTRGGSS